MSPAARIAAPLVAALFFPVAARAQLAADVPAGADYDTESAEWNGLLRFASLARGMGLDLEVGDTLEWDSVDTHDMLVLLYPRQRIEPNHLATFVRNGGRVLLGDDFGRASEAMARWGLLRGDVAAVEAHKFYVDLPYAPVARPSGRGHPLAHGVAEIVTNYPAYFVNSRGAEVVFAVASGEGIVAASELGAGRLVALADPSVLINRMLEFDGNLQLAINILRYLTWDDAASRLVLFTGDFALSGQPERHAVSESLQTTLAGIVSDLNRWFDERNDYLLTREAAGVVGLAAATAAILLGFVVIPFSRRDHLDGRWTRARRTPTSPAADSTTAPENEEGGRAANYLFPAVLLRDALDARLGRLLGTPEPLHHLSASQLRTRIQQRCGRAAARALASSCELLAALPTRGEAMAPDQVQILSRRRFERLHDRVKAFMRAVESE